MELKYTVKSLREAGLEARWTRTSAGAPILAVRNPKSKEKHQREKWWAVDKHMWTDMQRSGILEGFDSHTLLGDMFSIPA